MQGKKATYQQRKLLKANNLDTYKWFVQKDSPKIMQVVHIETGETRTISK